MTGWSTAHTACQEVDTPERQHRIRGFQGRVVHEMMEQEGVVYVPVQSAHNVPALRETIQRALGGPLVSKKVARSVLVNRDGLSIPHELLEAALIPSALDDLQKQDPKVSIILSLLFFPHLACSFCFL